MGDDEPKEAGDEDEFDCEMEAVEEGFEAGIGVSGCAELRDAGRKDEVVVKAAEEEETAVALDHVGVLYIGYPFRALTIEVLGGAELIYIPVNIFINWRLRGMLHDATLRLPVEITTFVLAAFALFALTFSGLKLPRSSVSSTVSSQSRIR